MLPLYKNIMISLLKNALNQSFSYADYNQLVSKLLAEKQSTNQDNSEAMLHYSELNLVRSKRLDKTLALSDNLISQIQSVKTPQYWIVLTEGWCGDAAQSIPVMQKMAEINKNITLRLVLRDQNIELMDLFLTNGGRSIPKLIAVVKQNFEILFNWGPRPLEAQQLIDDYKVKHGRLDEVVKTDLQKWYTKDKGLRIAEEIIKLLPNN